MEVYLPKIAINTLIIAPITTTHPAITFATPMNGTAIVPSISAKPTARDTMIPTIQASIAINPGPLFAILLTSFSVFIWNLIFLNFYLLAPFLFCEEVQNNHCYNKRDYDC
tara:strand:- start:657 stop:989 length:333 start_codon:yes stop_codon:yes gene_type:complete